MLNVESINLVFLKSYNTDFEEIFITLTDQNGRLLEIEVKSLIWHCLLINRDDTLLYRTKNKKI